MTGWTALTTSEDLYAAIAITGTALPVTLQAASVIFDVVVAATGAGTIQAEVELWGYAAPIQ